MKEFTADEAAQLTGAEERWAYNALDGCATLGASEEMRKLIEADPENSRVYTAERKLLAPALAVSMRGILIDKDKRPEGEARLEAELNKLQDAVRLQTAKSDLNIRSHQQLKALFFCDFGLAEMRNKAGKVSTDVHVLKRIADNRNLKWIKRKHERPTEEIVKNTARLILEYRDLEKQRQLYSARLHHGRMRCTLSVGSTETWRFSATGSAMGDGRNLQNIRKAQREIFTADPGFKMYQIDQQQAESMTVAYLCGDPEYIKVHEEQDTHVAVARLCRPNLDWPDPNDPCTACGGIGITNEGGCEPCAASGKEEIKFAREKGRGLGRHSLRDLYKRVQHALNYLGTFRTVARVLGISEYEAQGEIDRYYGRFPGIPRWHETIIDQIKNEGIVYYPGGYKRIVTGHRNDRTTWGEIIASYGQSIVGWINHTGFANIWHELDGDFRSGDDGPDLQVLMHGHDAVLFQARSLDLANRAHEIASAITWPMPHGEMRIPWEFKGPGDHWQEVS